MSDLGLRASCQKATSSRCIQRAVFNCLGLFLIRIFRWCSFEKTLKQKLAQKASGASNEEAVLLKAFKYFDLNNNGTVEPDEFAKAVEKIGIMIPTRQVSQNGQEFLLKIKLVVMKFGLERALLSNRTRTSATDCFD